MSLSKTPEILLLDKHFTLIFASESLLQSHSQLSDAIGKNFPQLCLTLALNFPLKALDLFLRENNMPRLDKAALQEHPQQEDQWRFATCNDQAIMMQRTPRHQHALEMNYKYLQSVVNHVPHFIFWKNKDSVFLGCNLQFAKSAGLNHPDDIVGKTDFDLPWSKEAQRYVDDDLKVIRSGQAKLNIEEPQTSPNGTPLTILTSKVPMLDAHNNVSGVLGIYTDITQFKNSEKELIEAKNQADASNQAKTSFIANMSHDIRTPLAALIELTHAIKEEPTLAEALTHIKPMNVTLTSLLDLLNDLIELTGNPTESKTSKKKLTDVNTLLESMDNTYARTARIKGLTFTINPLKKKYHVYIDVVKVHRVLLNLLGNAIKFTHQGEVSLSAECTLETQHQIQLALTVTDTGIGILEDQQQLIFDRFHRLQDAYSSEYQGVGLGLAICKNYIEAMDGRIEVISQREKGSQFIVHLTLDKASPGDLLNLQEEQDNHQALEQKNKDIIASRKDNPFKILLVEDHILTAELFSRKMKKLNCLIDHVRTGLGATEAARKNNYDLILMDIGLPDQSGFEAAASIRQFNTDVPIVALTAHLKENCAIPRNVCNTLYTKPLTNSQLLHLLATYAQGQATLPTAL